MPLPEGFFTPAGDPALGPPVIQADAIDPHTKEFLTLVQGLDPTDAAVLLALTTIRGTGSAVMDKGVKLPGEFVNERSTFFFRSEVELALSRLVLTRQIRLEGVEVQQGEDWVEGVVTYTNLAAQRARPDKARVPFILPEAA